MCVGLRDVHRFIMRRQCDGLKCLDGWWASEHPIHLAPTDRILAKEGSLIIEENRNEARGRKA